METMNKQAFLVTFIVAVTILLVGVVSAADLATGVSTEFNSVVLSDSTDTVSFTQDTVPVRITFVADKDASDVKVRASLNGLRDDVIESTDRFDIIAGKTYTKLLNLELPSKVNDRTEELTLYVEVVNKEDKTELDYSITIQRDSYELRVLSVDYNTQVQPGETFPISVVVKNTGFNRNDDNYVVASIPQLGVTSRGYLGDLVAVEDYINYDDEEDSVQKLVYLQIPSDAPAGVYEMTVKSYNDDAETEVTRLISVGESTQTTVLATKKTQDVSAGETAKYELIIVNGASTTKIFTISAVSSKDLIVSVPSAVAVGPGASKTVTVEATVPSDTEKGTYTFSTDVDGKQVVFAANVVNGASGSDTNVSPSIVGLTVVLVIVFIVLLIVLIILISRKDNPVEEVETSYY